MKWKKWLEKWDMTSLKINLKVLEMEWQPKEADKNAAWELYVEMLTRITTQQLQCNHGDEKTALDSIYSLFPITREIIKKYGRDSIEFTKIAVIVLNQKVRPFTAKWHRESIHGAFKNKNKCKQFRQELAKLQIELCKYTRMLSGMADVEDLTQMEKG
ncbi:MAG: hypothetical protein NT145_04810 [Elusimicrobia bacterium]|nr:hypothetical protein [Elusimicrobiota bacterium]